MSHVEKLQFAYEQWHETRGGNVSAWLELLADDVTFRSLAAGAPGMEFTTTRCDRGGAACYFTEMVRAWEMIYWAADEFIAEGDRVVMIGRCSWRNRKTGKAVESPTIHIWKFHEGKAVDFVEYYDTAKALEAARPD